MQKGNQRLPLMNVMNKIKDHSKPKTTPKITENYIDKNITSFMDKKNDIRSFPTSKLKEEFKNANSDSEDFANQEYTKCLAKALKDAIEENGNVSLTFSNF